MAVKLQGRGDGFYVLPVDDGNGQLSAMKHLKGADNVVVDALSRNNMPSLTARPSMGCKIIGCEICEYHFRKNRGVWTVRVRCLVSTLPVQLDLVREILDDRTPVISLYGI